jgi:hypothetical protein
MNISSKGKWKSNWQGWEIPSKNNRELPHPPTNINQVTRLIKEIDPHPFYTKKYK